VTGSLAEVAILVVRRPAGMRERGATNMGLDRIAEEEMLCFRFYLQRSRVKEGGKMSPAFLLCTKAAANGTARVALFRPAPDSHSFREFFHRYKPQCDSKGAQRGCTSSFPFADICVLSASFL
jgi:hypothetical protein